MPVIAVVNRKGGCGKTTLATHLAAYCANADIAVMLGDVDRQQSTQTWLRLREARRLPQRAPVVGWAVDPKRVMRPPAGIQHVVLDTPGGLHGFDIARVAMCADAVLLPVCSSMFDREASAECYAELMALPRVAGGRCRVAAVGMRLDARTRAADMLQRWAAGLDLPLIGVLRETQAYVRCIEQGLALFDLPAAQVQADMDQWKPVLEWLEPVLRPVLPLAVVASAPAKRVTFPCNRGAREPAVVEGAGVQAAPATTGASIASIALSAPSDSVPKPPDAARPRRRATHRFAALFGWLPVPRFLQRNA